SKIERKKALENSRFTGFSRASSTFSFRKLHSHLFCDFLSEVLFLLLDSFACLVTGKAFDGDVRAVSLCNLSHISANGLLAVLSLYIYLVKQADLFQLFFDTSGNDTLDNLLRL